MPQNPQEPPYSSVSPGAPPDSERLLVLLAYGLLLIAPPTGGLGALAGVVIAHIRLAHVAGQIHESHYRNQIRVFWTLMIVAAAMMLLLTAMGVSVFSPFWPFAFAWAFVQITLLLPLLWCAALATGLWYYWRLLRGFVRSLNDQPY